MTVEECIEDGGGMKKSSGREKPGIWILYSPFSTALSTSSLSLSNFTRFYDMLILSLPLLPFHSYFPLL